MPEPRLPTSCCQLAEGEQSGDPSSPAGTQCPEALVCLSTQHAAPWRAERLVLTLKGQPIETIKVTRRCDLESLMSPECRRYLSWVQSVDDERLAGWSRDTSCED